MHPHPGWPHLELLTFLTSGKTAFPNRIHPQGPGLRTWTYLPLWGSSPLWMLIFTLQGVVFTRHSSPGPAQVPGHPPFICTYPAIRPLSADHPVSGRQAGSLGAWGWHVSHCTRGCAQSHNDVWVGTAHNPLGQVQWGSQTCHAAGWAVYTQGTWRLPTLGRGTKTGGGAGDRVGCQLRPPWGDFAQLSDPHCWRLLPEPLQ